MRNYLIKAWSVLCLFFTGFLFYLLPVSASEVGNSQEINTLIESTRSQNTIPTTAARDWGLSESEWASYVRLMQGPNGRWYPQLSPAAVLGLNATTVKERQHFADLLAQQEHDKIARELTFNHEFYLAMRRLYPLEPIIQPFDKTPFNPRHKSQP